MPPPPNILWVVTTQWRGQATGYAGDPNARTPNLDRLAREAANFRQAVTPHPFGPFARAALLTGTPSPENGVAGYFDPLPPTRRTVAHELGNLGYRTAFFGKWHLAPRDPGVPLVGEAHARLVVPPEHRGGFEFWEGFEGGFLLNDPWLHGTRIAQPVRVSGYQSDVLCDRAREWIASQVASTPWFCLASLEAPHPPYAAPTPGSAGRRAYGLQLRPNVPTLVQPKALEELAGYYAHIEATDRALGGLVAAAPANTVIVFTSVHGDMHGSHGLFRKGWPHEESVRVPLLIRLPETLAAGWSGARDELVSLLDLSTWSRRWAEGKAFAVPNPASQRISMPSVVALPHQCDRVWRGERTRTRKTIAALPPGSSAQPDGYTPWLDFDLERDPYELANRVTPKPAAGEALGAR